jgi:hypothetical protein
MHRRAASRRSHDVRFQRGDHTDEAERHEEFSGAPQHRDPSGSFREYARQTPSDPTLK